MFGKGPTCAVGYGESWQILVRLRVLSHYITLYDSVSLCLWWATPA